MVINMDIDIKTYGLELQGTFTDEGYRMSKEENEKWHKGEIAVFQPVIHTYNFHKGTHKKKTCSATIVNMVTEVSHIDIFYDTEDEYHMSITVYLKNGEKVWKMSRDHDEVQDWKKLGFKISESYGY